MTTDPRETHIRALMVLMAPTCHSRARAEIEHYLSHGEYALALQELSGIR